MILDTNKRWEILTGLTKEESLGKGWVRALYSDDVLPTLKAWEEALRTGNLLDVQYRIHSHDGDLRWMRARAAPRRDADGKIIRWYGTLEDIDDYKKAEDALRRSEARLQAIFDAVPIGIVIADAPHGRVVMGNPRAEAILRTRVTPEVLIDDYCRASDSFTPGNTEYPSEENPLADAILNGRNLGPQEYLRYYSDGTSAWVSLSAAPVIDHDGTVSGGVVAVQDIDEDKRERQRLSDLTAALKNKLATHR
jgi:PAS domain S-box-containing protein